MRITRAEITPTAARRISIAAWVMAAFGTVAGELHALSRINSHPEDLEAEDCTGSRGEVCAKLATLRNWAK